MNWPLKKLGEISPAKPHKFVALSNDTEILHVNLDQVESGTGRLIQRIMKPLGEAGNSTHGFNNKHVLYSKLRPYLNKVFLPNEIGLCTTELVPMLPNENLVNRIYLAHYLKSRNFVDWISNQTAGAKMPRVSMDKFWAHEIPVPPLSEQKRIAAILDKADNISRKRQQAIKLADEFLRAVFLEMFGELIINSKNFSTIPLGDIIVKGPSNGLYKPSSAYVDSNKGEGTPILRIDGFYNGKLVKNYVFKRLQIDSETRNKFALNEKSIVINRVNSKEYIGKSMLVDGLKEVTVFESNMMNFSVDESRVIPQFLTMQLSSEYVRNQIAKMRKDAVNQSSINQQDVKAIKIRLPSLDEQNRYCRIAKKIDIILSKFEIASLAAQDCKSSLDNQYFQ